MDKFAQINQLLDDRFDKAPIQVWSAVVKSVQGATCTVDVLGTDLTDVEGVNLLADEEAQDGVLLTPRVGSLVYVASLMNSMDSLFVCAFSEVDNVVMMIGGVNLTLTKNAVVLTQDKVVLTLKEGKVSIKNAGVSLTDLFSDLTSLLTSFKVITPVQGAPTPSVSLDPGTTAKIQSLSAKVNQLLA